MFIINIKLAFVIVPRFKNLTFILPSQGVQCNLDLHHSLLLTIQSAIILFIELFYEYYT